MNVYDFDGTIFSGDSTKKFYFYCLKKNPLLIRYIFIQVFFAIAYFFGFVSLEFFKEKFFCFLKGIKQEEKQQIIDDFWKKEKSNIKSWYLEQKKDTDIIISASPSFLLKPVEEILGVTIIATDVDLASGKFLSRNCKGEEKVSRLKKFLRKDKIEIDNFYSDSKSDRYLAKLANNAFLIKHDKFKPFNIDGYCEDTSQIKKCSVKKNILTFVAVFLSGIILLQVLNFLVYLIPTSAMQENITESAQIMYEENIYRDMGYGSGRTIDTYTDALMILYAGYEGDESIFEKSFVNYINIKKGVDPYESIIAKYVFNEETESFAWKGGAYANGYVVVLKPLLTIFNYSQIRIINIVLESIIFVLVIFYMWKRGLNRLIIPLIASYLFLMPVTMMNTMIFSVSFYITFLSILFMLVFKDKLIKNNWLKYVFLAIGLLEGFNDLLMFPLLSFGLPAVIYFSLMPKANLKINIVRLFNIAIFWGVGIVGILVLKWCLASTVVGTSVFATVFESFFERKYEGSYTFLSGLLKNAEVVKNNIFIIPLVILFLIYLGIFIYKATKYRYDLKKIFIESITLLILICLPVAWVLLFNVHSLIHHWFTYRIFGVSIFACLTILARFANNDKQEFYIKNKVEQKQPS